MHIGPKSRYLYSVRADRGDMVRVCSEAVDNSLDALAHNVLIAISNSEIKFTDDGIGVLLKNFPALFTLGDHVQLTSTRLGRFGVGITAQAINAADMMEVRSVSADGCFLSRVNWRDVLRYGWDIDDPVRLPLMVGTPTSTIIKLSTLRKLKQFTISKVVDDLAERFYPAIAEGRTIQVNDIPVPLLADPAMVEVIEQSFEFSNGRTAELRAGLLAQPSKMNRVHVGFGHRVIMPASPLGCGSYTGLNNMFARVQLAGDAWALSSFKNDLTNEDQREELEEALEAAMSSILKKCGNVSIEARVVAIGELVNEMLSEELAAARPRRTKRKEAAPSGKRENKNPGTVEAEKSDEAESGPARSRRAQKDRLIITFEGKAAEHGIGWFEPGRPNRVNLSPDAPQLARLLRCKDDEVVASAMLVIAVQLFEQGRTEQDAQLKMLERSFGLRVAQHLLTNNISPVPKQAG